jgi:hypothetical protein
MNLNSQNDKNTKALAEFDAGQLSKVLSIQNQILDTEKNIEAKESISLRKTGFLNKIITAVGFMTILSISLTGALIAQNIDNRDSNANAVYSCQAGETLTGASCISPSSSYPVYGEGCPTGYITMQSVCAKVEAKACTNYAEAVAAETGLCKINVDNVLLSEITDSDGRTCNGNGFNFKRYNVGLPTNSFDGPIVCASAFSGVFGKENFRFIPSTVISITNLSTSQTGSTTTPCLTGYTPIEDNSKCSRPATISGCNAGGEYLTNFNIFGSVKANAETTMQSNTQTNTVNGDDVETSATNIDLTGDFDSTASIVSSVAKSSSTASSNSVVSSSSVINSSIVSSSVVSKSSIPVLITAPVQQSAPAPVAALSLSCKPCPAGQYCPNNSTGASNVKVCANGGVQTGDNCIAQNKITSTTYTDGCAAEYVKLDKTCAIVEVRTHDLGCSYYYASDDVNVLAVLDGTRCSTGGRTDFASTSIVKVDGPECDGPGSAWYNYNVAYDPLVCGIGDPVNKTAFRWSVNSYTKITGLQKIPTNSQVCPATWTAINTNDCFQPVVVQEYKARNDCPVNTYCPEGSVTPIACPANTTSPAKSTKLADCLTVVTPVTPPTTTTGGSVIIISTATSSVTVTSSSVVVTAPAVCVSKPGEYFTNGACIPCIAGYYCQGGTNAPIICPVGYYCPPASAAPTICPVGTTTIGQGSKVLDDCKAIAKPSVTAVRSGGLQVFVALFSILSLFFFGYLYMTTKNAKGAMASDWMKIK